MLAQQTLLLLPAILCMATELRGSWNKSAVLGVEQSSG
jgi:hypothetical protein